MYADVRLGLVEPASMLWRVVGLEATPKVRPWGTVYTRFNRWSKSGVWESAFLAIRTDMDDEWNFIDSTIVKAHQHAAGGKKGVIRPLARAVAAERLRSTRCRMPMATPFASGSAAGKAMIPRWPNR